MPGNRLTQRVSALEGDDPDQWRGPWAWTVCRDGETYDEAVARYEGENGPLDRQPIIVWSPVVAVPCA